MAEPMGLDESCYDPVDGKIHCRAGSASFWTTWDGYLLPCGMLTRPKVDMEDRAFEDVWTELVRVTKEIQLSGVCEQCENHSFCHACAAMALAENGDFQKVPRYLCEMMEAIKRMAAEQLKIYDM